MYLCWCLFTVARGLSGVFGRRLSSAVKVKSKLEDSNEPATGREGIVAIGACQRNESVRFTPVTHASTLVVPK